jgi:uncharacterized protein (DUF3084 family)
MIRVYALIFVLAILGGVGYGAFWYYNDTQARIAQLRENSAKLEVANQTKDATIKELQENIQKQLELTNELNIKLQKSEQENRRIAGLLQDTDVVANSVADPVATEQAINEEIDLMFRSIESITDSQ